MDYQTIVPGRFLTRPNRFIAHVEVKGETVVAHVKNTGRCRELLVPGATVYLERAANPARKTAYSLVAVEKAGRPARLINMDSQAPNKVVGEALAGGWLPGIPGPVRRVRPERIWGDSRFDFELELGDGDDLRRALLEVKGVTLEEDGRVLFPDAPTERGVKHIRHLIQAAEQGLSAGIVFVVQMADVDVFLPNERTQPAFGAALRAAAAAGVSVSAWSCTVTPGSIRLAGEVPVEL